MAPETPGIKAKALTHATAKWDWLADEAGPGTHVLRLSYGRREEAGGGADLVMDDESLLAAALEMLPVADRASNQADIVDWDVVRWAGALPFAAVGHKQRVAQVRRYAPLLKG